MKNLCLLFMSSIMVMSLNAQKVTEEFVNYSFTVQPDIYLKSANLFYSFESPFENKIQKQLDHDKEPTRTPKEGGGYTITPPVPANIVNDYLNVIYLEAIERENTLPIYVKFDISASIDTVYGFNLNNPNLSIDKPISLYHYTPRLTVIAKDGEIYLDTLTTVIEKQYFTVMTAFNNDIFEDYDAKRYTQLTEEYSAAYEKLVELYKITNPEKYESELLKLNETHYQNVVNIFDEILMRKINGLFVPDLIKARDILIKSFSTIGDRIAMPIYGAKNKYDYTEINICQINARDIIDRKDKGAKKWCTYEELKDTLTRCINVWEKECGLVDFEDPKARINKDVYIGLQFNIMNAYILIGDFKKAKIAYAEANKYIEKKFMAVQGSYLWFSREMEKHFMIIESKSKDKIKFYNNGQL